MRKQSVNFKAELRDPGLARLALRHTGVTFAESTRHTDTYFKVPDTHLKRRVADNEPTEYFLYERRDAAHPALARFTILTEQAFAQRFGERPLPVWVTVRKSREIWLTERAHIHLDTVDHLGGFIEIEALVSPSNNIARCHEEIARLRQQLAPALGGVITTSYAALMATELNHNANTA